MVTHFCIKSYGFVYDDYPKENRMLAKENTFDLALNYALFFKMIAFVFLLNTLIPSIIKTTSNALKNILVKMIFITENILVRFAIFMFKSG